MRIYIIRHADPDYENQTITEKGHQEARVLAERMQKLDIDRIYCSTLGRAQDTMKYTSELLEIEPKIEDWLKEIFEPLKMEDTPWGTLAAWNLPGEVIRKGWQNNHGQDWSRLEVLGDRGQEIKKTYRKLKDKSDDFFRRLGYLHQNNFYKIKGNKNQQVAVFTHGGFSRCWIAHLLGIPLPLMWSAIWLAPSSVTTILFEEREEDRAVPRCLSLGDTSHLYKAGLEPEPRGLKANYF